MIKKQKVAFLIALVASFSGLSAEEEQMDSNREVSMSKSGDACAKPEDCKGGMMEFDYYRHDPNDADHDVYTQGEDGECEPRDKGCSGKKCGRKGAAASARE